VLVRSGAIESLIATVDPTQLAVALRALLQNSLEALGNGGRVEVVISDFRFQIPDCPPEFQVQGSKFQVESPPDAVLSTEFSVPSTPTTSPTVPAPHFATAPNLKSEICNLKLTVTDTGPGIPPHVRPHLFDPFFSGREAGRGLGLGLSKAWRIVTSHGGTLTVQSPETGGAVFTIDLPGD
jgi:signal transduction histidine kinase